MERACTNWCSAIRAGRCTQLHDSSGSPVYRSARQPSPDASPLGFEVRTAARVACGGSKRLSWWDTGGRQGEGRRPRRGGGQVPVRLSWSEETRSQRDDPDVLAHCHDARMAAHGPGPLEEMPLWPALSPKHCQRPERKNRHRSERAGAGTKPALIRPAAVRTTALIRPVPVRPRPRSSGAGPNSDLTRAGADPHRSRTQTAVKRSGG